MKTFVYSLLLALLWNANAFQSFTKSIGYPRRQNSHLYLVDPITFNVGVAVFSAAAGMASQQPKIQQLETELEITKKTLSETEGNMANKIKTLEDRLFTLDREYETQTSKFQKEYETRMTAKLEEDTAKVKRDMNFRMDIQMEQQKSKLAQEKLEFINSQPDKDTELFQTKVKLNSLSMTRNKLEKALEQANKSLEQLQKASKKTSWFS